MNVADVIPDDRIDWSPGHDVMSFGDVLRHLAMTERWLFAEVALLRPSRYRSHGPELATSKRKVLDLMRSADAETVQILGGLEPAGLLQRVQTPAGATMSCWKWLRAMIEHEVHHRGQLYLMLRLCDVPTPSIFGLTSEEVRSRAYSDTPQ